MNNYDWVYLIVAGVWAVTGALGIIRKSDSWHKDFLIAILCLLIYTL